MKRPQAYGSLQPANDEGKRSRGLSIGPTALAEEAQWQRLVPQPQAQSPFMSSTALPTTASIPPNDGVVRNRAFVAERAAAAVNRNALQNAQQQLAAAMVRQKQTEEALLQCQQEQQQAAAMVDLLSRQTMSPQATTPNAAPVPVPMSLNGNLATNHGVAPVAPGPNKMSPMSIVDASSGMFSNAIHSVSHSKKVRSNVSEVEAAIAASLSLPPSDQLSQQLTAMHSMNVIPNYNVLLGNSFNQGSASPISFPGAGMIHHAPVNTPPLPIMNFPSSDRRLSVAPGLSLTDTHKLSPVIRGKEDDKDGWYDPGPVKELGMPSDKGNLSEYQCLLRQQIVLFSVSVADIQCSAQGRNKPIQHGQVGVLCRYCAKITPGMRPCGAAYFPAKLSGIYQASQNMAINHFSKSCRRIPEATRARLKALKEQKSTVLGGGKHFWANAARVLGVVETEDGHLRFKDP